jgi:choline dehydrogenase-like flavoprotein
VAVAASVLTDVQRETLAALCDTYVPFVDAQTGDPVERDFLGRAASDMEIPAHIEQTFADTLMPEEIAAFAGLLDALAGEGFAKAEVEGRTAIVHAFRDQDPEAKLGLHSLKALTMLFFYALPDEQGHNPNWEAIGYPGAPAPPPADAPKTISIQDVSGEAATLECDVCVVGSGAGGGVIAARAAEAGKDVLVLEAGAYRNESDFKSLELPGMQELYYGGGLAASEDGSISILAGQTLGGGTVVNYMNCIPTPERIVGEWGSHGLLGLDDYESYKRDHIDVVMERVNANTEATTQNETHKKLMAACDALGYEHRPIVRNVTLDDEPEQCGFCFAGCPRGCKRSVMKTWLQDASDAGAKAVVGCHADRVLVEDGRAAGVAATVTHADGSTTALTIDAPTVIVACGSVESPGLLLRSGIGGPAVGKNLRLHPAYLVTGIYDEPVEGWRGQIQSLVSDEFADIEDGCGFLFEATSMHPGIVSASMPWESGQSHKELMQPFRWLAPFITVARDHGSGEVVLDDFQRPVVRWGLTDDVDRRLAVRAHVELARLHQAAGASQIFTLHARETRWREGEDFDEYVGRLESASYEPNDVSCFTAHQMGSCRMGSDPAESVADGRGELHDVKGVWIGDASAFPTAPGVNPMISIMSLAHRTADQILSDD